MGNYGARHGEHFAVRSAVVAMTTGGRPGQVDLAAVNRSDSRAGPGDARVASGLFACIEDEGGIAALAQTGSRK
jgi:hypothetical protein